MTPWQQRLNGGFVIGRISRIDRNSRRDGAHLTFFSLAFRNRNRNPKLRITITITITIQLNSISGGNVMMDLSCPQESLRAQFA